MRSSRLVSRVRNYWSRRRIMRLNMLCHSNRIHLQSSFRSIWIISLKNQIELCKSTIKPKKKSTMLSNCSGISLPRISLRHSTINDWPEDYLWISRILMILKDMFLIGLDQNVVTSTRARLTKSLKMWMKQSRRIRISMITLLRINQILIRGIFSKSSWFPSLHGRWSLNHCLSYSSHSMDLWNILRNSTWKNSRVSASSGSTRQALVIYKESLTRRSISSKFNLFKHSFYCASIKRSNSLTLKFQESCL